MQHAVPSLRLRILTATLVLGAIAACRDEPVSPEVTATEVPLASVTVNKAEFNIASGGIGTSLASDGTNALVGYQSGDPTTVRAKLISTAGTVIATISTGRMGDPPYVAFDGTNFLLVWADHSDAMENVWGQFIKPTGALYGSAFRLSQTQHVKGVYGVDYANGKYLVMYRTSTNSLLGRFVNPNRTLGSTFTIASSAGDLGVSNLASDGTQFVAVYTNEANTKVYTRVVRTDGTKDAPVLITGGSLASDAVCIGYTNGTYLVLWNKRVSSTVRNPWAQRLSQSGALVGSNFAIDASPSIETAAQAMPYGTQFLVGYLRWTGTGSKTVYGRLVSTTGSVGTAQTYFTKSASTGKVGLGLGVKIGPKVFFSLIRATVEPGATGFEQLSDFDLHGVVLTP
jgi:hypothetical protein